jgi:hypothetical protein
VETIYPDILKVTKPYVQDKILEDASLQSENERQVIVHCHLRMPMYGMQIRIWKTTYLRDQDSAHKSKLLGAYNITEYPVWQPVSGNEASFTLVFQGLPKDCLFFDLFEDIPDPYGFYSGIIARNNSDIYSVEVYCD